MTTGATGRPRCLPPLMSSSASAADAIRPRGSSSPFLKEIDAQRGLSREQVPILVATVRGGATVGAVLQAVTADAWRDALEPAIERDILLVSDAHLSYRPCATALGGRHEALNATARERMRDTLHIQMVNSRHGQLKGFLRDFRGIATKYLDSYLRWFYRIGLVATPCPRTRLVTATSAQFDNRAI